MQVGEEYIVRPELAISTKTNAKPSMRGTVVWVHPKLRFAVLEFEGIHGKPRECFYPNELTAKNRVQKKRRRKE